MKEIKWFIVENWEERAHLNGGYANGYVCLPVGHKFYGAYYDDIVVDIHGGITFSTHAQHLSHWDEIPEGAENCWIIGFDTFHAGDGNHLDKEWCENEAKKLAELMSDLL